MSGISASTTQLTITVNGQLTVSDGYVSSFPLPGPKVQAVLAMLAITTDYKLGRTTLQRCLWPRADEPRAANSLSQALSKLRACLNISVKALCSDNQMVWLDRNLVDVQGWPPQSGTETTTNFFEGLRPRNTGFETWLESQIAEYGGEQTHRLDTATESTALPVARSSSRPMPAGPALTSSHSDHRPWVRIHLPDHIPEQKSVDETGSEASRLLPFIARLVVSEFHNTANVDVCESDRDYPGLVISICTRERVPDGSSEDTDQMIEFTLATSTDRQILLIVRHATATGDLVMGDRNTELRSRIQSLVQQSIQILRDWVPDSERASPFILGLDAVQCMFSLDSRLVVEADAKLAQAYDMEKNGLFLAWRAYLRCIMLGERFEQDRQQLKQHSIELITEARLRSPNNPTVLALAAYVCAFVAQNFVFGLELAKEAYDRDPGSAFARMVLSRLLLYQGKASESTSLALSAPRIAGSTPYSPLLDFNAGVSAMSVGKNDVAIDAAEKSLLYLPEFRPPMRLLLPLYLASGQFDKARAMLKRIRNHEPDFSLEMLRDAEYPSAGIRQSGILDDLPHSSLVEFSD